MAAFGPGPAARPKRLARARKTRLGRGAEGLTFAAEAWRERWAMRLSARWVILVVLQRLKLLNEQRARYG
jgi:hypothetical protein